MAIKHVERPKFLATQAIEILRNKGFDKLTMHSFIQAWKSDDLKNSGKGLAIQLGGSWFWYQEGIDRIAELLPNSLKSDGQAAATS